MNYYHSHLLNLSSILEPIHSLMKKGTTCRGSSSQRRAFEETKEILCSASLLTDFHLSKTIPVQVDASLYGLGAIMFITMENGSEKLICLHFINGFLMPNGIIPILNRKERLALVFAVRQMHQHLYRNCFTIFTGHKPLLDYFQNTNPFPFLLLPGFNAGLSS